MKALFLRLLAVVACLLAASSSALCADPFPPVWSVTLLSSPFHVGDDNIKAFSVPQPNARQYHTTFTLSDSVSHTLADRFVIVIDIADLTSPADPHSARAMGHGKYLTKLYLNGAEITVLNRLVHKHEGAQNVDHLVIPIESKALKDGQNTIEIVPGSAARNIDDFELRRVVVQKGGL
ncbi:MAG: hypothetical protein ABJF10_25715 [Chthoniobacter sp.]|uniref:hypothetical protein n=1 Tax=Chthoniobacter sp. TaxID=2510640 RepID=UPI0032A310F7